jgi:hypothetical protein
VSRLHSTCDKSNRASVNADAMSAARAALGNVDSTICTKKCRLMAVPIKNKQVR